MSSPAIHLIGIVATSIKVFIKHIFKKEFALILLLSSIFSRSFTDTAFFNLNQLNTGSVY